MDGNRAAAEMHRGGGRPMTGCMLISTPDLRPSLQSVLRGLAERNLIGRVTTTISIPAAIARSVARIPSAGRRLAPLLRRREIPEFLDGIVDNVWVGEVLRNLSSRVAGDIVTDAIYNWATCRFDNVVAERYAGAYQYVYGMDFSSAATFAAQKSRGGRCIQRQVSAHFASFVAMLRRECERFPEFATDYHRRILQRAEQHRRRRAAEHALADLIIANSHHARSTFIDNGIPPSKIVAVPTGCPAIDPVGARSGRGGGPLRFVYAGQLSLRKGFHYLMQAWTLADFGARAELWIAGGAEPGLSKVLGAQPNVRYLGRLSQLALAEVYRQADVMVLPTLSEGLAHVVLEALAFGMPAITTAASGAGGLVTTGDNGSIVPEANAEALAAAMTAVLGRRRELPQMGKLSAERARRWTVADSNAEHARVVLECMKAHA